MSIRCSLKGVNVDQNTNGIERTTIEIIADAIDRTISKQIGATGNLVAVDALKKAKSNIQEVLKSRNIVEISRSYQ